MNWFNNPTKKPTVYPKVHDRSKNHSLGIQYNDIINVPLRGNKTSRLNDGFLCICPAFSVQGYTGHPSTSINLQRPWEVMPIPDEIANLIQVEVNGTTITQNQQSDIQIQCWRVISQQAKLSITSKRSMSVRWEAIRVDTRDFNKFYWDGVNGAPLFDFGGTWVNNPSYSTGTHKDLDRVFFKLNLNHHHWPWVCICCKDLCPADNTTLTDVTTGPTDETEPITGEPGNTQPGDGVDENMPSIIVPPADFSDDENEDEEDGPTDETMPPPEETDPDLSGDPYIDPNEVIIWKPPSNGDEEPDEPGTDTGTEIPTDYGKLPDNQFYIKPFVTPEDPTETDWSDSIITDWTPLDNPVGSNIPDPDEFEAEDVFGPLPDDTTWPYDDDGQLSTEGVLNKLGDPIQRPLVVETTNRLNDPNEFMEMFRIANRTRVEANLEPWTMNSFLSSWATKWAEEAVTQDPNIVKTHRFEYGGTTDPTARWNNIGIPVQYYAENVTYYPPADQMNNWKRIYDQGTFEPHVENTVLKEGATHTGIGQAWDPVTQRVLTIQIAVKEPPGGFPVPPFTPEPGVNIVETSKNIIEKYRNNSISNYVKEFAIPDEWYLLSPDVQRRIQQYLSEDTEPMTIEFDVTQDPDGPAVKNGPWYSDIWPGGSNPPTAGFQLNKPGLHPSVCTDIANALAVADTPSWRYGALDRQPDDNAIHPGESDADMMKRKMGKQQALVFMDTRYNNCKRPPTATNFPSLDQASTRTVKSKSGENFYVNDVLYRNFPAYIYDYALKYDVTELKDPFGHNFVSKAEYIMFNYYIFHRQQQHVENYESKDQRSIPSSKIDYFNSGGRHWTTVPTFAEEAWFPFPESHDEAYLQQILDLLLATNRQPVLSAPPKEWSSSQLQDYVFNDDYPMIPANITPSDEWLNFYAYNPIDYVWEYAKSNANRIGTTPLKVALDLMERFDQWNWPADFHVLVDDYVFPINIDDQIAAYTSSVERPVEFETDRSYRRYLGIMWYKHITTSYRPDAMYPANIKPNFKLSDTLVLPPTTQPHNMMTMVTFYNSLDDTTWIEPLHHFVVPVLGKTESPMAVFAMAMFYPKVKHYQDIEAYKQGSLLDQYYWEHPGYQSRTAKRLHEKFAVIVHDGIKDATLCNDRIATTQVTTTTTGIAQHTSTYTQDINVGEDVILRQNALNASHAPDSIAWISNWPTWDGVTTIDPNTVTFQELKDFVWPDGPWAMRGLRDLYYEIQPFQDEANPTIAEIENWLVETINLLRRITGQPVPVHNDRHLYQRAHWSDEMRYTRVWDAAYPDQTCAVAPADHCGATFTPNAADQAPYLREGEAPIYYQAGGTEGLFGIEDNWPWSVKFSRMINQIVAFEGNTGHGGPFFGRPCVGMSMMGSGSWINVRMKWNSAEECATLTGETTTTTTCKTIATEDFQPTSPPGFQDFNFFAHEITIGYIEKLNEYNITPMGYWEIPTWYYRDTTGRDMMDGFLSANSWNPNTVNQTIATQQGWLDPRTGLPFINAYRYATWRVQCNTVPGLETRFDNYTGTWVPPISSAEFKPYPLHSTGQPMDFMPVNTSTIQPKDVYGWYFPDETTIPDFSGYTLAMLPPGASHWTEANLTSFKEAMLPLQAQPNPYHVTIGPCPKCPTMPKTVMLAPPKYVPDIGEQVNMDSNTTSEQGGPISTSTASLDCNKCVHDWNIYPYKDTILIKFTNQSGERDVNVSCHLTTNREYEMRPGTYMQHFETFNAKTTSTYVHSKKLDLNSNINLAAATFLKNKRKYGDQHTEE